MKITRAVVPSLFTVLNMFCGFFSIIHSSRGDFEVACWLIILGGVFDSLDGVMARITKTSSRFGVEFDSLSDLITFGVAPSFIAYKMYLYNFEGLGVLISSLPLILGGIRLARFNVQLVGFDKDYFSGLPIPAQALTLISFVLINYSEASGLSGWHADIFIPMLVVVSLLMVSTFKYDTLPKFTKKNIQAHPIKFSAFGLAIVSLIVTSGKSLFILFVLYLLSGIFRWVISSIKNLRDAKLKIEPNGAEKSSIDV